jgi:CDP-4-dehydro-6-deoxyglucose reductase, E1
MSEEKKKQLRATIAELTAEYYQEAFATRPFVPGESAVPVSGRFFDAADLQAIVESGLDFWLTAGRFADLFEHKFAKFLGLREARLVNSGSSANLVAISALTSPTLGERRLKPGDEVITVAAGFPTTINPILQNGAVPVFIDIRPGTYNVDVARLEEAWSERTRAIILAHTLGNAFNVDAVVDFARRHDLWLIEDCCDALGSRWNGRLLGTFGHLATFSFYPAHHITMGEGGCVVNNDPQLGRLVESFRDWGRDCWCPPGHDNTCGKRFDWQLGSLPYGYDHKFTYSHIGYNLKVSDMQAAVGLSQLNKLPAFIERRKENFRALYTLLEPYQEFLILPETEPQADVSWFGFPLGVREGAPFIREDLLRELNRAKIGTRLLFGGNLLRQPAYRDVKIRVVGPLDVSDFAMNRVFWIGVFPGLTPPMLAYIAETIGKFIAEKR